MEGGPEPGKLYWGPPSFVFEFSIALTGIVSVIRFIDLYYKRHSRGCKMTLKFPDTSIIELENVSRKTALRVIQEHEEHMLAATALLDVSPTRDAKEARELQDLIVKTIKSVSSSCLIPKDGGQPALRFENCIFNGIDQKVIMGDSYRNRIGRISGSNVIFKAKGDSVGQTIGSSAADDNVTKTQLIGLHEQLKGVLKNLPSERREEAAAVTDAADVLVNTAMKDKPNKNSIRISARGLLDAAKGVADVLPVVRDFVKAVNRIITGS
jgi:hypothetical protein